MLRTLEPSHACDQNGGAGVLTEVKKLIHPERFDICALRFTTTRLDSAQTGADTGR